jgi:hypothetical protein
MELIKEKFEQENTSHLQTSKIYKILNWSALSRNPAIFEEIK